MDQRQLYDAANSQLDRVLGFFPRVDAKASVVLAVDTGMLAFLAAKTPPTNEMTLWDIGISVLAVIFLGLSFWQLYKGAFPRLEGGNMSLVYFREIAGRTEARFIDEFKRQTDPDYINDLLGQVWRNSEILKEKFNHVKNAFLFLALAIPPWLVSLVLFSMKTAASRTSS